MKLDAPDLRVISPDLWQRVHDRLKQGQNVFIRRVSSDKAGQLLGHSAMRDFDSPYLLSGFARCRNCGGPIDANGLDNGGKRRTYGCEYQRKRGASICNNAVRIDQDVLNTVLLQAIGEILDERLIEKALARIRSGDETRLSRKFLIERESSWPGFDGHLKWGHDSPRGGATWANDDGSPPSLNDDPCSARCPIDAGGLIFLSGGRKL